LKGGIVLVQ